MKDITDKDLERFLLGELSEEERDKLEAQFFADDELFEQMLASEDDLFDRLVNGELSDRETANFQKRLVLTPQQKNRMEFARALKIKVAEIEEKQKPDVSQTPSASWWRSLLALVGLQNAPMQFAFAALSVLLLLGCAWLVFEITRLNNRVAELQTAQIQQQKESAQKEQEASRQNKELSQQAENERARNEQLAQELEQERQQREQLEQQLAKKSQQTTEQSAVASFFLLPGLLRDEQGVKRLQFPPLIKQVRLQLDLRRSGDYQSFRAVLRTIEGQEIFHQDALTSKQGGSGKKALLLNLPARLFVAGDYRLVLTGLRADGNYDDIDTYYFRVLKEK